MAAGAINMKQILEDLKSSLTKEVENKTKKITEKITETKDRKAEATETLAKQNQNNIDLTSESTALQEKLEQEKKIGELEENIEDHFIRNSRDKLVIYKWHKKRKIKRENME